MWEDPIVAEVHRIREQLAAKFNYDVEAIFAPNGRYGAVNWRTIGVFLVGIAVEIPFMNASYPQFEGPAAHALSGADISWLVGFVITGALYFAVTPRDTARPG